MDSVVRGIKERFFFIFFLKRRRSKMVGEGRDLEEEKGRMYPQQGQKGNSIKVLLCAELERI